MIHLGPSGSYHFELASRRQYFGMGLDLSGKRKNICTQESPRQRLKWTKKNVNASFANLHIQPNTEPRLINLDEVESQHVLDS